MKVLIIRSNPVAPEPRVEKCATALSKCGYQVNILAFDRTCNHKKYEKNQYCEIWRFKARAPYGKPSLIPKLIIWNIYEFIFLLKSDAQIIHACDFDTLIPAVIIAKLKKKRLIYDSFDFYADFIPNLPKWIRKFIANIEIFFANLADCVILADESRKEQYNNRLRKTIIINNTPNNSRTDKYKYEIGSERVKTFQNKNIFKIFFAGVLLESRGFEHIAKASSNLEDVQLTIAGYGSDENYIVSIVNNYNHIEFLGKIDYEEVLKRTLQSDVLFALYDPSVPNNKYSSPNKLFEAMMCGKPIIVSDGTSMANIVRTENCGLVVPYGDVEAIRNAIIRLKEDQSLRESLGQNGKKAYESKYSWHIMEERLLNVYRRVCC